MSFSSQNNSPYNGFSRLFAAAGLLFLSIAFAGSARAELPCSANDSTSIYSQAKDLCQLQCAMEANKTGSATLKPADNCKSTQQILNASMLENAAQFWVGCLPSAGSAAVDVIKGALGLDQYEEFVKRCKDNVECQRTLARNLEAYRVYKKDASGNPMLDKDGQPIYQMSDTDVDKAVKGRDLLELQSTSSHNADVTVHTCQAQLVEITKELGNKMADATARGDDAALEKVIEERFTRLQTFDPDCPKLLKISRPKGLPAAPDLKKAAANALGATRKIGSNFTDQITKFLNERNIALQCYDEATSAAIRCYAATYVGLQVIGAVYGEAILGKIAALTKKGAVAVGAVGALSKAEKAAKLAEAGDAVQGGTAVAKVAPADAVAPAPASAGSAEGGAAEGGAAAPAAVAPPALPAPEVLQPAHPVSRVSADVPPPAAAPVPPAPPAPEVLPPAHPLSRVSPDVSQVAAPPQDGAASLTSRRQAAKLEAKKAKDAADAAAAARQKAIADQDAATAKRDSREDRDAADAQALAAKRDQDIATRDRATRDRAAAKRGDREDRDASDAESLVAKRKQDVEARDRAAAKRGAREDRDASDAESLVAKRKQDVEARDRAAGKRGDREDQDTHDAQTLAAKRNQDVETRDRAAAKRSAREDQDTHDAQTLAAKRNQDVEARDRAAAKRGAREDRDATDAQTLAAKRKQDVDARDRAAAKRSAREDQDTHDAQTLAAKRNQDVEARDRASTKRSAREDQDTHDAQTLAAKRNQDVEARDRAATKRSAREDDDARARDAQAPRTIARAAAAEPPAPGPNAPGTRALAHDAAADRAATPPKPHDDAAAAPGQTAAPAQKPAPPHDPAQAPASTGDTEVHASTGPVTRRPVGSGEASAAGSTVARDAAISAAPPEPIKNSPLGPKLLVGAAAAEDDVGIAEPLPSDPPSAPQSGAIPVAGTAASLKQKGPREISSKAMRELNSKMLSQMKRLGLSTGSARGLSYIANQLRLHPGQKFVLSVADQRAKSKYLGSLYAITKLPKTSRNEKATGLFLTHPGAAHYVALLKKRGANIYIDSSLPASGMRSYVRPHRFIGIRPDLTWSEFQAIYRYYQQHG